MARAASGWRRALRGLVCAGLLLSPAPGDAQTEVNKTTPPPQLPPAAGEARTGTQAPGAGVPTPAKAAQHPWSTEVSERAVAVIGVEIDGEETRTRFSLVLSVNAVYQDFLLADPDAYVNTLHYVEGSSEALPHPLVSVQLGNFIVPLEAMPNSPAIRLPVTVDKGGVRGWNRAVIDRQKPPRPALLDAVLELEFMCKMCDVSFSDNSLSPVDSEVILQSIAKVSGMVPLFVF